MLPRLWPAVLTLGWILMVFAVGEAVMALFSLAMQDGEAKAFAAAAVITGGVAGACILTTSGRPFELNFRDAAILTVAAWTIVPFFAGLPFVIEPVDLTPVDAYFEMVSGFTTTGSSVMTQLDIKPPSLMLWRSTVSWIGGMGIIALAIVILPFLKIGGMQLFRLESSERSDNPLPRVRQVTYAVAEIYLVLTLACVLTYWWLGMTPLDAVNHAFTTLATCGFSTHDASFGYFESPAITWAGTIFMAAGGLPFLAYYRLISRGTVANRLDPQSVAFIFFLLAAGAVLALFLRASGQHSGGDAFREALFNVVSIVTTTGFASTDYLKWGAFPVGLFFVLTFVGGCTGSTAGGIKILRFQILISTIRQHVVRIVYPHAIVQPRYGSRAITNDEVVSVGVFVFLYFVSFAVLSAVMALTGLDAGTAMSSVATALGNVGPGIGPIVGPAGNFATFTDFQKLVMSFAMILGRLEILSVMVLFLPSFYR